MSDNSPAPSSERVRVSTYETTLAANVIASAYAHRLQIVSGICVMVVLTLFHHAFFPRYTGKAVLLVQRAENSPLQAMMGKMTGHPGMGGKRNEYLEKYRQYLNSREFFLVAAREYMPIHTAERANQKTRPPASQVRVAFSRFGHFVKGLFFVKAVDPSAIENEIEDLASSLSSGASFVKSSEDNLTVQVDSANFQKAVDRANFLAVTAVKAITGGELKELNDAKSYIVAEQAAAIDRIGRFDKDIVSFRNKSSLVKTDATAKDAVGRISELQNTLENNELKLAHNTRLLSALSTELQKQENELLAGGAQNLRSSAIVDQLRQQIQSLRYEKMLLQAQGFEDTHPQVARLNQGIDQVAERLKKQIRALGGTEAMESSLLTDDREGLSRRISFLRRENQSLGATIETLRGSLKATMKSIDSLPSEQQKMIELQRNSELEFTLLTAMKQKILEIDLERVALDSKVRLLEKATIAGIPARLNILPKAFFAVVLSFFAFAALAYAADEFSSTIKNRNTVKNIGMIPVGNIPWFSDHTRWSFLGMRPGSTDVLGPWKSDQEWPAIQAIKHIRAMVGKMRSPSDQPAKTICILGATAGDGKSFVSANIALALAQIEKKTLILDGDLRRPTLAMRLKISGKVGLTSYLTGALPVEECLHRNLVPGLDVLPSGPCVPHPTELLGSPKFAELIAKFRQEYDYIVIDTPPLLPIVDGLTLSGYGDALIMAVSHRKTRIPDLQAALEKIRQFSDRPVFAVYNRSDESRSYNYLYAYTAETKKPSRPSRQSGIRQELAVFKDSLRKKNMGETPSV